MNNIRKRIYYHGLSLNGKNLGPQCKQCGDHNIDTQNTPFLFKYRHPVKETWEKELFCSRNCRLAYFNE